MGWVENACGPKIRKRAAQRNSFLLISIETMPVPVLTPCSFEQASASGADSVVYVTANYKNDDYR